MNKLLGENLPWKIASFVLAMILWLFVINTQNPTQPQEIRNVPITIKGLEELEAKGYVLKNKEAIRTQNFRVVIKGPRLEVDRIYNDPSLITATLNLNQYMADLSQDSIQQIANYTVDIALDNNSISITDKKPEISVVILEKEALTTRTIDYSIPDSITANYKLLGEPIITPTTVELTGAKSDIEKVDRVSINIEEGNFSEDVLVQRLNIHVYDVDGNELEGIIKSPQTAQVRLLIGKAKTVPLKITTVGEVQEGYIATNISVIPTNVTIVGKAEVVNEISEIEVEPIDLSSITETTALSKKINLPAGVTVSGADEVVVTVEIDKENTYIYTIPVSQLIIEPVGLGEGLSYQILTEEIQVSVAATADTLLSYSANQIAKILQTNLDLTGYTEGEYTLQLGLTAPEKIKLLTSFADLEVRITEIVESEPPITPSEEEEEITISNAEQEPTPEDSIVEGEE